MDKTFLWNCPHCGFKFDVITDGLICPQCGKSSLFASRPDSKFEKVTNLPVESLSPYSKTVPARLPRLPVEEFTFTYQAHPFSVKFFKDRFNSPNKKQYSWVLISIQTAEMDPRWTVFHHVTSTYKSDFSFESDLNKENRLRRNHFRSQACISARSFLIEGILFEVDVYAENNSIFVDIVEESLPGHTIVASLFYNIGGTK